MHHDDHGAEGFRGHTWYQILSLSVTEGEALQKDNTGDSQEQHLKVADHLTDKRTVTVRERESNCLCAYYVPYYGLHPPRVTQSGGKSSESGKHLPSGLKVSFPHSISTHMKRVWQAKGQRILAWWWRESAWCLSHTSLLAANSSISFRLHQRSFPYSFSPFYHCHCFPPFRRFGRWQSHTHGMIIISMSVKPELTGEIVKVIINNLSNKSLLLRSLPLL